jgi:hypothetical protein
VSSDQRFPAVRKARELLKERAVEIYNQYVAVLKQSAEAGDYETAAKGYQFLIEHMPAEDGETMIDISVDKPRQVETKYTGPSVQIGIALGGIPETQKALVSSPTVTIDAVKVEAQ